MISLRQFSTSLLGFAIELLKLLPIMLFVFGFKLQSTKKIVVFGLCSVALLTLATICGVADYIPIHPYICVALTILIIYGNNRILYTLMSYLGICILDMLTATIWLFLNDKSYVQLTDKLSDSLIVNAISIAIISVVCLISKKLSSKRIYALVTNKISRVYLLLILIGEMSLLAFLTVFQLNENAIDGSERLMAIVLSVGSTVFLLVSIVMLVNYFSKNHYKNISEINEKLVKTQEQYYTMLLQKDEETRKFRHDINNHLNCMRLLFEQKKYDELGKYFNKIGASMLELRPAFQLGNDLISAILNDVADKYPSVSVNIAGRFPDTFCMDNADICTIFYNLFDNAFAAADRSEGKAVEISVKLVSDNLFLTVKNTVLHKVEIENNVLKTNKQDKTNHGYGSGNAVLCADRNSGTLTYKCSDTHFEAELILPNIN